MTIDLSQIDFSYDFYSSPMPDGSTLVLNKVSENLLGSEGETAEIKRINVLVQEAFTENNVLCSSVIGMGDDRLAIGTTEESLLGKVLDEDNLSYCYIEMYEE